MQYDQPVVEGGADAVAREIGDHVVAEALGVRLDNPANHVDLPPGFGRLDAAHHRLIRAVHEVLVLRRDLAREESGVGVAVHPVLVRSDVDVDNVALLDHRRVRDAVADDFVQRDAAGLGETAVAERGRVRAVLDEVVVDNPVDLVGGLAGGDGRARQCKCVGRDLAGLAHRFDRLRGLDERLPDVFLDVVLPHVLWAFDGLRYRALRRALSRGK